VEENTEVHGTSCSPTGTGSQSAGSLIGRLGGFLRAHSLAIKCMCAAVFLTMVCSFLVYDSSLAKQVEYNRSDLIMLSCEMLTEAGPRLHDTAERHAGLLRNYLISMEPRRQANILTLLPYYRNYSAEKGISEALATLESVDGNDVRENLVAVWKAGEQLMQFRDETNSFFRPIGWYKPGEMPESLLQKIEEANDASLEAWVTLNKSKTLFSAWRLCEANRRTLLLIFAGRGYDLQKDAAERFQRVVDQFQKITAAAAEAKGKWWGETLKSNCAERRLGELFAQSEGRRCKILQAMANDKMDEVHELMWEAIEKARKNREKVLEMALELKDKTRDWKQLGV